MIRNIAVILSANSTSFAAQMRTASMSVGQFGDEAVGMATKTDTASRKTLDTVGKLSLALSAGLVVALGASVAVAANFEREMRNVASISPTVQRNFDGISSSLVDMSRTMPQSASTLAKGLYDIVSSGFDGAEAMTVLKSSAMAASAGLTTTATSARAITAVLNAYGMSGFEASRVSDVLFQTVNKGVVSFEELAGTVGDFVGMAAAAGVPIEDASAALATMTLSGVSASEAGTSLNRVLQSLIDPSEAMTAHLKSLGYESGTAAIEALGLQGTMDLLRTSTGGNIETLVALFPEIRAARGALALMADEGRNYADVAKGITDQTEVMGATQRAYNEQSKGFSFQLELAKNNLAAVAIEIGQAVLPALTSLVQMIGGILSAFSDLPGPVKAVLGVLALVVAAAAAVGGAFLLLSEKVLAARTVMQTMQTEMPALAGGLGFVSRAAGVLGLAMGALTVYLAITGKEKERLASITDRLVTAMDAETRGTKGAIDAAVAQELARKGLIASAQRYGVVLGDLLAAAKGDEDAMRRVAAQSTATGDAKDKLGIGIAEVATQFRKATGEVQAQDEALRSVNPNIDETRDKLAQVEQILGPVGDALGATTSKVKELDDIQKAYNESMKGFADGASVYKDVLDEKQAKEREARDALDQTTEAGKAAWKDFKESTDITLGEYNAGLQKQIDAAREWTKNYTTIFQTFGPQVATILANMGEEGRIIAAKMTEDLTGEGRKTAELLPILYGQAGVGATQQLFVGLMPSSPQTRKQVEEVSKAVTEVLSPLPGWTGEMARTLTNYLATQLDPAIPRTGQQARDTAEALKFQLTGLPGWTQDMANTLTTVLAASLDPMIGKTGQTAEDTAEALRSRLSTLPGWTQGAGNQTTDQWLVALGRGTGRTAEESRAWASALITVLNSLLTGVGGQPISMEQQGPGDMGYMGNAEGGYYEQHDAQIAPGGAWRVWAEPETGGEAYIPLAEAKRGRSKDILRQVAGRFGMVLVEEAYGGILDDLGLPMPPTAEGAGHMVGRTAEDADGFTYQKVRAWVDAEKKRQMAAAAGGGAPYTGGDIGSGWQQITGYLDSKGVTYIVTSTTGGGHVPGSLHYQGKAVDLVGSGDWSMGGIFSTLGAGNPVPGINELFYDPAGYYYDEGNRYSGAIGGHENHVHAGTFDRGGILWPGYTLAWNGTGRPEAVLRFANGNIVNTGAMSTNSQHTGASGAVSNTTTIGSGASRYVGAGAATPGYITTSNTPPPVDHNINGYTYTGEGGNLGAFASRLIYRLVTGEQAVYDDNLNGRPDAWDNGRPPGLSMGASGAVTTVDNSVSVGINAGAVSVDVRVSPGADTSAIQDAVRQALNPAMQALVDRLTVQIRQTSGRVRV